MLFSFVYLVLVSLLKLAGSASEIRHDAELGEDR
jgi:hypothetical protein